MRTQRGKFKGVSNNFSMELENIDKAKAIEYLDMVPEYQRKIRPNYVRLLTAQMERAEFVFTGEPIAFNVINECVNGQHRLQAVKAADVVLPMVVHRNVPLEAYQYFDQGSKRTLGDFLDGNTCLAAASELLAVYETKDRQLGRRFQASEKWTIHEKVELIKAHPGLQESASKFKGELRMTPGFFPPARAAFLHYLFSQLDQDDADLFWQGVVLGEGLRKGDPRLVLRNRLISEQGMKHSDKWHYIQALTVKAWNAFREGQHIQVLRFNSTEKYPQLQ